MKLLANLIQDCIPEGCIPPACWPHLQACTAQGGAWSRLLGGLVWGSVCSGGRLLPGVPGPGSVCSEGVWHPSMHRGRPPCEPNSWHTLLKTLPCPKLRLRAVKSRSRYSNKNRCLWNCTPSFQTALFSLSLCCEPCFNRPISSRLTLTEFLASVSYFLAVNHHCPRYWMLRIESQW